MSTDFHVIAATLAEAHARSSVDLLAAVASGHRQLVPVAIGAGVAADAFCETEHRTIWCALEVAAERECDQLAAAQLVRRGLQAAGLWWPQGPLSTSAGFWNDESLGMLFTSYPPGTAAVETLAVAFVANANRWRRVLRAAKLLDRAVRDAIDALPPRSNCNTVLQPTPAAEARAA